MSANDYMNREQVSKYLNVSSSTVDNLKKKGLPYIKIGKLIWYKVEDVKTWLDQHRVQSQQHPTQDENLEGN